MSPIDPTGAAAFARSGPYHASGGQSPQSGAEKAVAQQSSSTTITAAAPVESRAAVAQAQGSEQSQLRSAPPGATSAHSPPLKPMTALLLHELRLQQELADLQEKKET